MPTPRPAPFLPQRLDEIQAWFFDLDGTLMDTDDQAVDGLAQRLRILGPSRSQRSARRLVMLSETPMNWAMTLLAMVGLDSLVFAMRRRLSHNVTPTFRLIPGVRPLIERLATLGQLAVVSTRSQHDAALFLAQHELAGHFALSATQETTKRLKDVRAARRAGAWAVGVLCGFGEERELWRAGAHMVLGSTAELLDLVQDNSGART